MYTLLENFLYKLYLHSWNKIHIFTAQNIVAFERFFINSSLSIPRTQHTDYVMLPFYKMNDFVLYTLENYYYNQ